VVSGAAARLDGRRRHARSRRRGRRVLLGSIVVSLTATALLAAGILLFGRFGETEGRILGSTALLAGYGLLSLPAGFLLDQRRRVRQALSLLALAAAGAALALATIWSADPPETLGRSLLTVTALAVALAQTDALTARRRPDDPASVTALFVLAASLASVLAALVSAALWAGIEDSVYFRFVGALAVLDLLAVALQPILAAGRRQPTSHRVRLVVESGDAIEATVDAPDFAAAAAKLIRSTEREGRRVRRLERLGEGRETPLRRRYRESRGRSGERSPT
jgi:MFS family permease